MIIDWNQCELAHVINNRCQYSRHELPKVEPGEKVKPVCTKCIKTNDVCFVLRNHYLRLKNYEYKKKDDDDEKIIISRDIIDNYN